MATGWSKLVTAAAAFLMFGLIGGASAYAEVATDGTAGPRVRLDGPEFEIGADLGTRAGRNLFHSFERFSLDAGERATFSGPDQIRNVISRVTGGARSDIDGTLRSTIPGADFYFLNPAGVMFGPDASLDVQGSVHVSTADELRFRDGTTFSATDPSASSLTVARPEAFGFLGPVPASILVDRSMLEVPPGEAFSIIGGDITIRGDPQAEFAGGSGSVRAEGGEIALVAIDGPGQARLHGADIDAAHRGDISLINRALVESSGDGGGRIRIRGNNFVVEDRSLVDASNVGVLDAVGGIDIDVDRVQISTGGTIDSSTFGEGDAGTVTVEADRLLISAGGIIDSSTFSGGDAGTVTVEADRLLISGADTQFLTGITSSAESDSCGDAGSVQVVAGALQIVDGGIIDSSTFSGGDAGTVTVEADRLLISGDAQSLTGITSRAERGSGDAGSVQVVAGALQIVEGGTIYSSTSSEGDAGTVMVEADRLLISAGSVITSSTFSGGDAGTVTVEADRLLISGAADALTGIASNAVFGSSGGAGSVQVVARALQIVEGGRITSSTFGEGDAGTVTVEADRLLISGAGTQIQTGITSSAGESGDAGSVQVVAGVLQIVEGGTIDSLTFNDSEGDAGTVTVEADRLLISAGGAITSSTFGEGDAGTVTVEADRLLISGVGTSIASRAQFGSSDAGSVQVVAGALQIVEGGTIDSSTFGEGDAGTVTVEADRLLINGADSQFLTGITSSAVPGSSGDAGSVRIQVETAEIADGGVVTSSAGGKGAAGDVIVRAADRLILNQASITTESASAGGGEIQLLVGDVIDLHNSEIATSIAGGADRTAGSILIDPKALVIDGSRIQANAPAGFGGRVTIVADNILVPGGDFEALVDRGDIDASGGTPERAGTVTVDSPEVDLSGGLVVLEGALLDAASQLRERCGARRDIGASSFTGVGRGGLPPSPDGPLVSAYVVDEAAVGAVREAGSRLITPTAPADVRLAGLSAPCAPLD